MGKMRTTLKIVLPTIVIGASGVSAGKCSNTCTYEVAKRELRLTQPTCREAREKLMKLKQNDEYILLKYFKGMYGQIEAYNDYVMNKCKPKE